MSYSGCYVCATLPFWIHFWCVLGESDLCLILICFLGYLAQKVCTFSSVFEHVFSYTAWILITEVVLGVVSLCMSMI